MSSTHLSNKWTTFPYLSPMIWASMCLGLSTNFSMKMLPLPKAFSASDLQEYLNITHFTSEACIFPEN